ncbi:MAG: hypothetical protein QM778_09775 [Myxococcales bacterium]
MRAASGCLWALACLLLLGGCPSTMTARAALMLPAKVPVRVFPSIWVAGGENQLENYLLDRLAAHLAQDGRREVRRVQTAELEPAREAGHIAGTTAVLFLRASAEDNVQRYWDSMPTQYCGYYGCTTNFQSYMVTAIQVNAHADLTVYEGPTARVLQQERFEQSVLGDHLEPLRQAAVEQLAVELERAVDVLRVRPRFELYHERSMSEVERALALIAKGDWVQGREHLELAAKQLGGQRSDVQARVWYNLGLARWAAPGPQGLTAEAYAAAHRALAWAQRLNPQPHHASALLELDKSRQAFETLEAQRQAAAHNFGLSARAKAEPAPAAQPTAPSEPGVDAPETKSNEPAPGAPPEATTP